MKRLFKKLPYVLVLMVVIVLINSGMVQASSLKQSTQEKIISVSSVNSISGISVVYGTAVENIGLPGIVKVKLSDKSIKEARVTWDFSKYNPNIAKSYTITGTLAPDVGDTYIVPKTKKASIKVTVKPPISVSSVSSVSSISVAYETPIENIDLPTTVEVKLSDKSIKVAKVDWDYSKYNPVKNGSYTFYGTITPDDGDNYVVPQSKKAKIKVTVKPPVTVSSVSSISSISVPYGTKVENIGLPEVAKVKLSDRSEKTAKVTWDYSKYNPTKAGSYTFIGTITPDDGDTYIVPENKKASIKVTVKAPVTVSSVSSIPSITVAYGTTEENIQLPTTVRVTLSDGSIKNAKVNWDTTSYSSTIPGKYTLSGTLTPLDGDNYTIPSNKTVTVNVEVSEIPRSLIKSIEEFRNAIHNALENFDDQLLLKIHNYDESVYVLDVINDIISENPIIDYGYDGASAEIYYTENNYKMNVTFNYKKTKEEMTMMKTMAEQKSAEIIQNIIKPDMNDYQKELAIHNYIVENARYDTENFQKGTVPAESFTDYGLLINGVAVCEGYAKSMLRLLKIVGINSYYVIGTADGTPHAWNIVELEGSHYHVDATFDDPVSANRENILSHQYFNITDEEMLKDHMWDRSKYPACVNKKYSYDTQSSLAVKSVSTFTDINVGYGTSADKLPLPTTVEVILNDESFRTANITWDKSTYNPSMSGIYTLTGTLTPVLGDTYSIPYHKSKIIIKIMAVDPAEPISNTITVHGIVSLPDGFTAPFGGIKGKVNVNGGPNCANQAVFTQDIIIPEGENSTSYTLDVDPDIVIDRINVWANIDNAEDYKLSKTTYYGTYFGSRFEAAEIPVNNGNNFGVNVTIPHTSIIRVNTYPADGEKFIDNGVVFIDGFDFIDALTFKASVSKRESDIAENIVILNQGIDSLGTAFTIISVVPSMEGSNYIAWTTAAHDRFWGWNNPFAIADDAGYLRRVYYGEDESYLEKKDAKEFFVKPGEDIVIDINALKRNAGNTIKGKVMLPEGEVAPKGGQKISLTLFEKGADSLFRKYPNEIADLGLSGPDVIIETFIKEGENSVDFSFNVSPDESREYTIECDISDSAIYPDRIYGYYKKGFWAYPFVSMSDTVSPSQEGTYIEFRIGSAKGIYGAVNLPDGQIAEEPLEVKVKIKDILGEQWSKTVTINAGESGAEYSINIPMFSSQGGQMAVFNKEYPRPVSISYEINDNRFSSFEAVGFYNKTGMSRTQGEFLGYNSINAIRADMTLIKK